MKRRHPAQSTPTQIAGAAVRTGEHCPRTGWWFPLQAGSAEPAQAPRFIGQGSVMPALGGAASLWLPGESR